MTEDTDRILGQLPARLRDEVASLYFGNGSTHPL